MIDDILFCMAMKTLGAPDWFIDKCIEDRHKK